MPTPNEHNEKQYGSTVLYLANPRDPLGLSRRPERVARLARTLLGVDAKSIFRIAPTVLKWWRCGYPQPGHMVENEPFG
jgi:hypothetical protein